MKDVLAALSAALAAIGWGATGFCLLRLWGARHDVMRHDLLLLGALALSVGVAIQATVALTALEWSLWALGQTHPAPALAYRLCKVGGLLTIAGAVSFPRCGHRGWLALAACGAGAAVVSLVF